MKRPRRRIMKKSRVPTLNNDNSSFVVISDL